MENLDWVFITKVLSVILASGTKFLLSPLLALSIGFTFKQSLLYTTIGGTAGIFVFAFLGDIIRRYWRYFTMLFVAPFSRKTYKQLVHQKGNRFNRRKRLVVRIKDRFGLLGIAFVTPCIISIPIGTILAINIYKNKKKVILYLLGSLLIWSLVLNTVTLFLFDFLREMDLIK
jgi:hypothetical protein